MIWGITRFPGTNCDRDVWKAVELAGGRPRWLWHQDQFDPSEVDRIVVPGGFSFGDYLRSGALAARTPVMRSVVAAARRGVPILGICNGFQILTEAGLLPGALLTNESCRFVDGWVDMEITQTTPWTRGQPGSSLRLPVAHGTGRFFASDEQIRQMEDSGQVWLRYRGWNPNGAVRDIAGVCDGNVAALMPHPERAMTDWMGSTDGLQFFAEAQ